MCPVVTQSESQCHIKDGHHQRDINTIKVPELSKNPGLCSEMEVNLAPNKIKLLPTMQLVKVTKKKFLPTQWLKSQQIGNKHIFFCLSSNGMVATGQIIIESIKTWEQK